MSDKTSPTLSERETGLDFFRLMAMIFITVIHLVFQRHKLLNNVADNPCSIVNNGLMYLSFCGVNCFALLSGYLLGDRRMTFNQDWLKRILRFWLQCSFYSGSLLLIMLYFSRYKYSFSVEALLKACAFLSTNTVWWYIRAYFGILVILPLLNTSLAAQNRKQRISTCWVLIIFFSVFTTFTGNGNLFQLNHGFSICWLAICYYIGAVIKLDGNTLGLQRIPVGYLWGMLLLTQLLPVGWYLVFDFPEKTISETEILKYISPFIFGQAVFLLLLCRRITISWEWLRRGLAIASGASLGIYLIHCHTMVFREFFINTIPRSYALPYLMHTIFRELVLICIAGITFELIRQKIFSLCGIDRFAGWSADRIFQVSAWLKRGLKALQQAMLKNAEQCPADDYSWK